MKNQVIGVVLATVAAFMWGFLYWGLASAPYSPLIPTSDDEAVQQVLRDTFPESGTYLIPSPQNDPELLAQLFEQGPMAMVYIEREGHPMEDPAMMGNGFVVMLISTFLISVLMKMALPGLPNYKDRVLFALLIGIAATVTINYGDAVWWRFAWGWQTSKLIYVVVNCLIVGLVLGKFIKPAEAV